MEHQGNINMKILSKKTITLRVSGQFTILRGEEDDIDPSLPTELMCVKFHQVSQTVSSNVIKQDARINIECWHRREE